MTASDASQGLATCLVVGERKQGQMPRTFDLARQPALVLGRQTGLTAGPDLGPIRHKTAQRIRVFVVRDGAVGVKIVFFTASASTVAPRSLILSGKILIVIRPPAPGSFIVVVVAHLVISS